MLDIKKIRSQPEKIKEGIKKKGANINYIDDILAIDEERRKLLVEVETLKAERNRVSEDIGRRKKQGEDTRELEASMRQVSQRIKEIDDDVARLEARQQDLLYNIPNIPHESVPVGPDETANVEIRRWGEPKRFAFQPKAHWDLGVNLGILDFERATKISGTRFTVYRGLGARLERALINFMLDLHINKHGYQEIFPPFMVNRESMIGTGQLPKFEEDMFRVANNDFFLIPTAEVPVTNLHRDEILNVDDLPIYYVAYSACFRAEAGAAGKDTRGLIRQHQFNKVELVKFVTPETSYDELEKLVNDAEDVLKALGLPYRVVCLSTGDMSFSSAKTYDLEVYLPSYNGYKEISSCSNFEDYQARRAAIRFRRGNKGKPELVHTLNGSGVAVGRTVAAILENYQNADGTVTIPEALRPYMGGIDHIG